MGQPAAGLNARPLVPRGDCQRVVRQVDRGRSPRCDVGCHAGLGRPWISIESLVQKAPAPGQTEVPIVLLTHMASESVITDAIDEITAFDEVSADFALLRVEAFE